jgi:hypothetical protein
VLESNLVLELSSKIIELKKSKIKKIKELDSNPHPENLHLRFTMSKLRPKVPFKKEEPQNTGLFVSSLAELTQQKEVEKRCKDEPYSPSQIYSTPTRVYPDGLVKKYQ